MMNYEEYGGGGGEYWRRGHVPAFGSWDWNDAVPFTQCFETARHAGLLRYAYAVNQEPHDLYVSDDHLLAPAMILLPRPRTLAKVGQETPRVKRNGVTKKDKEQRRQSSKAAREDDAPTTCPSTPVAERRRPVAKPVDEDLYKISPELLKARAKKGNGGFGCFSRCFFPTRVL